MRLAMGVRLGPVFAVALLGTMAQASEPAPQQSGVSQAGGKAPANYAVDARGRSMRVRFDPESTVWVQAGMGASARQGGAKFSYGFAAGVGLGAESVSGAGEERVRWGFSHRFADVRVAPSDAALWGVSGEGTLYRGVFLRHKDASYITIAGTTPTRIPFPLDIGVDVTLGRAMLAENRAPDRVWLSVVDAALLLDPLRTGVSGRYLAFGFGPRYDIDAVVESGKFLRRPIHRIAPMTAVSAQLRYRDDSGLTSLEAEGKWFPHWSSTGGWSADSVEAFVACSRVMFAINDQPVSIVAEGRYRRLSAGDERESISELRTGVALRLGANLK